MKLKHIDPMGAGRVAALGMRLVDRDEVVDVPEDVAPLLVIQTLNWQPADKAAEKLAASTIPEYEAALTAASASSAIVPNPDQPPADEPTTDETPGEGEPA